MTDQPSSNSPQAITPGRGGRLALALASLALAGTAALWLRAPGQVAAERARAEEGAQKIQRRLNALEDRLQRERDELGRLGSRIGAENQAEDSITGRIVRLEDAIARLPGGDRVRFIWLLEQAEYFMRIANAQETLAGDSASALTALSIADQHLRDAADPRLTPVRKLVATEMAALRSVPRVDTEGLVLKIGTLSAMLERLPPKRVAPREFSVAPASPAAGASGINRALEALRNAFMTIVSVRRTDAPTPTLLSDESASLLNRSLDLELQMARLALLRGEAVIYRSSLADVRRNLEQHFDTSSTAGASALAVLDELAGAPLPDSLPDVSASLTELVRIRESELKP